MLEGSRPVASVKSAIEAPSKPRSQQSGIAASRAASLSKLIGRLATAKRFVKEGAYVFITGRRQVELEPR